MNKVFSFVGRASVAVLAVLMIFQLQSCSEHKGIMQCPAVGYNAHHDKLPMHALHNGNNRQSAGQRKTTAIVNPADNSRVLPAVDAIAPVGGYATSNNDVPKFTEPMELFKHLSAEQRDQVKAQVSTMMAKNKIVRGVILKKLDKMDKKYPAPPPAQAYAGGGALSLGEILSIVAIACAVTWVLGIVGLIVGIVALLKINREGGANWARILSIVAIVLGAIAFLSFFGYFVFVIIL
jgi:hypothetical protein